MTISKNALDLAPKGAWFKSSYSNDGNNCVEIADLVATAGVVGVRDSKIEDGPALQFEPSMFASFINDVQAGRYDI
ncbi:DUF397 domain-containing protein [Streptomyces sp. NPDC007088]|uniref:DUF397 domain-containing protein n=1 Tax=Streptomyces sp. NPDC007088 TaxID=3364773 RepID=UPI0036CDFEB5